MIYLFDTNNKNMFYKKFKNDFEEKKGQGYDQGKTRNHFIPKKSHQIPAIKESTLRSSISSNGVDMDKQEYLSMKKLMNMTNTSLPRLTKINRTTHYISINKKLTNDLNFQINTTNKKIINNLFAYKQTINLQEINDYIIYEKTKKSIADHKRNGKRTTIDFRIPIAYRRLDNHYKKEDLIPIKMKPKINLEDVLYMHNSILRKSMSQNNCRNYYLKNNVKLLKEGNKEKSINNNNVPKKNKKSNMISFNNKINRKA